MTTYFWHDQSYEAREYVAVLGEQLHQDEIVDLAREDNQVIAALFEALCDYDYDDITYFAVEVLVEVGSDSVIEQAILMLQSEQPEKVCIAAILLLELKPNKAVIPLIQTLKTNDKTIKICTVQALGEISDQQAVKPIIQTLLELTKIDSDRAEVLAYSCLKALGQIGGNTAKNFLIQFSITSMPTLPTYVTEKALEALGLFQDVCIFDILLKSLESPDKYIRAGAAKGFDNLQDERSAPFLIAALSDVYAWVRYSAANALGRMKSREAIPELTKALEDKEFYVQLQALEALAKIGQALTPEQLTPLLQSKNQRVVRAAKQVLEELDNERDIDSFDI